MDKKELITKAKEAMKNAYSPYSEFKVGAALVGKSGRIYTGCNIENASFGATNCAERTAIFKAVSEGETDFEAIAIAGGKRGEITGICPPCGICRQVMSEFCKADFPVILASVGEDFEEYTLGELLTKSFELK